ncbi:MarC family protein [Aeoliella mucimassa]|uniref:UPF0056 membrane protein n=1 Tax=Aeoliella mucimassa TaxID=2527972 RepID=A0A518ALQ3_9BACT|nr:MarC family protein [Aeoliella mucimassa]QDU55655.1 putative antibiotic transporter [Aeoliella mucimassa]
MTDFIHATALLLALLNPFLVIIYLLDVIRKVDGLTFRRVLIGAAAIASAVFCCFALLGEAIFTSLIHAEFASFQVFGGIVFLLIGVQFVFKGPTAIEILRGDSDNLAGAIAMPVLIGPGTISASVVIGKRLPPLESCLAIMAAVSVSVAIMLVLKSLHDLLRESRKGIIDRYIEIAGRVTALYVGTVAVEMIMQGIRSWAAQF